MVNLRNLGRSRRITARLWRHAAHKYVNNLTKFVGTASVVGLAADTVATVARGHKRASDSIRDLTNKRVKRSLSAAMAHQDSGHGRDTVMDPNSAGYSQKKRVRDIAGRKLPKTEKKLKLLGAKMHTQIERWQACADQVYIHSSSEQFPGWFPLGYNLNPDLTDYATLPYFMFELNGAYRNYHKNGYYFHSPMLRLVRGPAVNAPFDFFPIAARNSDNSSDQYVWTQERNGVNQWNIAEMNTGDSDFFDYFDIRMQLYGARKAPVKITVQLINFLDDDYSPPVWGGSTNPQTTMPARLDDSAAQQTGLVFDRWNNHWLAETDRLLGNTINKRGVKMDRVYDVVYSKSFDFEPVMTTEGDEAPHNVQFELKYDYNKVVSYVQDSSAGLQIEPAEMIQANEWDVSSNGLHTGLVPNTKGRLFLKICADTPLNESVRPEGTKVCDWAGSFDLIVRRKRSRINFG